VLQNVVDMFVLGKLDKVAELNNLDVLATLYASVIHDFKHPGYNNGFMINSKSELAYMYNGKLTIVSYSSIHHIRQINS
jgi:hypothetical protein